MGLYSEREVRECPSRRLRAGVGMAVDVIVVVFCWHRPAVLLCVIVVPVFCAVSCVYIIS